MKSIRSILHILLGVTLICSCNEATELAHITPNVSLIKYKDIHYCPKKLPHRFS